jgi:hypothetical protein
MAEYSKTSPYYETGMFGKFLDVMTFRAIDRKVSDVVYVIDAVYNRRPDLLAHDLYGDVRLWWVFAARNPNTIEDPVFDFITGKTIYIPSQETLNSSLGL